MKTAAELIPAALIEIKEHSTKGEPQIMPTTQPAKITNRDPDFSDWKIHGEEGLRAPLLAASQFVSDIIRRRVTHDREGYALTFCGVSGTGKTFLSNCILNELGRNKWGELESVVGFIREGHLIRSTYMKCDWRKVSDGFKQGEFGTLEDMEEVFLLMLDDIGADYDPSSMGISKLDRVLRARTGKWTILTCNLTLSQIAENLDTRIASFLIRDGNKVCEIKAIDYALRPKIE